MNKQCKEYRRVMLASLSLSLLILILLSLYLKIRHDYQPVGRIIFRLPTRTQLPGRHDLIIADGNLNQPQILTQITGPPSFSTDGKFIAAGCQLPDKICIYDVAAFDDFTKFPGDPLPGHALVSEIVLPEACTAFPQDENHEYDELRSISWSPDMDRLVIVCNGSPSTNALVCILNLIEKSSQCWDHLMGEVSSAQWSPVDESIVFDTIDSASNREIYIVGSSGLNAEYLTKGWSPEWSPDGKEIAFFKFDVDASFNEMGTLLTEGKEEGSHIYPGIAKIKVDGSEEEWVFRAPPYIKGYDFYSTIWPEKCRGINQCRLAWSPEGRFIAFSAEYPFGYSWHIYRVDVKTGEINILSSNISWDYSYPDWGP